MPVVTVFPAGSLGARMPGAHDIETYGSLEARTPGPELETYGRTFSDRPFQIEENTAVQRRKRPFQGRAG